MKVTDEMVAKALQAHGDKSWHYDDDDACMRAALEAALSHASGQDGEQCRAASGYAGRLASKLEDVREGIADVLPIVYLETIDDAIEALRALSRGVPEGMVLVPVEPTSEMETAHRMYGDTSDWWQTVITAAIAAQRKEGE